MGIVVIGAVFCGIIKVGIRCPPTYRAGVCRPVERDVTAAFAAMWPRICQVELRPTFVALWMKPAPVKMSSTSWSRHKAQYPVHWRVPDGMGTWLAVSLTMTVMPGRYLSGSDTTHAGPGC